MYTFTMSESSVFTLQTQSLVWEYWCTDTLHTAAVIRVHAPGTLPAEGPQSGHRREKAAIIFHYMLGV